MKRIISAITLLALTLALLAGCASGGKTESTPPESPAAVSPAPGSSEPETRVFTDSVGREIELPAQIEKIAVAGNLAQIFVFALAPDMLVGTSTDWDEYTRDYIPEKYFSLPDLGQLYGGKGDLNLESLLAAGPDVVIDVGESKASTAEDLDALSAQTGIPFVHIQADISSYSEAYTMLGNLLGLEEEAAVLAYYCDKIYTRTLDIAASVEKINLLYIVGEKGLNVIANSSYHAEMMDLLCNNLAVVDEPSSRGTGNEVDMEQILTWDPDYIIFEAGSVYGVVASDSIWQNLKAIKNGNYSEAPIGPYNWMGFPPSVQRYLGMLWMAKLLYPDAADYDLYEEIHTYYELFYHTDLTRAQFDELTANS